MMMMMRDIPWVPHIGVVGADACAAGAAGYQAWRQWILDICHLTLPSDNKRRKRCKMPQYEKIELLTLTAKYLNY